MFEQEDVERIFWTRCSAIFILIDDAKMREITKIRSVAYKSIRKSLRLS
jgi:hypothetical protein